MKNLALNIILSTTIITSTFGCIIKDDIRYKGNAFRVFNEFKNVDKSIEDKFDNFWTPKNENYLNEEQKNKLNYLKNKVKEGSILTGLENNELKAMKVEVIKIKLGDEKFKELQKLIEKREGSLDLTLEERERLYKLNKEAKE